jgi:hypothetical protein
VESVPSARELREMVLDVLGPESMPEVKSKRAQLLGARTRTERGCDNAVLAIASCVCQQVRSGPSGCLRCMPCAVRARVTVASHGVTWTVLAVLWCHVLSCRLVWRGLVWSGVFWCRVVSV